jgi:trigger factor
MEINIKEPKSWLKEIEVTIEPERVKEKIAKITASYAYKAQIPGFRQGRIPNPVLQRRYGATFESMALDEIFDEVYKEIIKEKNFTPITQAKINDYTLSDDKSLKFEITFEVMPEFELKNYTGIKIKKQEPTGFNEEFDKRIKSLQERCATFTTLNRPVENNDFVLVDYEIFENDKPAAKKQNGIMIQVGSEKNHDEINKALIGAKAGEEKAIPITFDKDYPDKEFANRTITYKFAIRDVKERKLPEVNDTLATDLGFKDLSELKNQINEEILQNRAKVVDEDMKNQIYKYLTAEHKFEVPDSIIEQTYQEMLNELNIKDSPEVKERLGKFTQERAIFDLVLAKIGEKENIKSTPEQLDNELQKYIAAGIEKEKVELLRNNPMFIARLQKEKTIDWLLEKAEIN